MPRDNSVCLLHLSDIQFGKNDRFGMKLDPPDEAVDSLLHRLLDDLKQLEKDKDLRPDLIALTGDLAEWGLKSEFDAVLEFVVGLGEALKLERSRILLVPGNYDINRKKSKAYFADCASEGTDPQLPYWRKWYFFKRFFDQLFRDEPYQFTGEETWTLLEVPDLKLVVAGLNSTLKETHLDDGEQGFGHCGWVSERQLKWLGERLEKYRERD